MRGAAPVECAGRGNSTVIVAMNFEQFKLIHTLVLLVRLDMSHNKELKRREELDLENSKLTEQVNSLKEEKATGFELNDQVGLDALQRALHLIPKTPMTHKNNQTSVDLAAEKRLTEKLREEIDGWKDEANIYHNKLTSKSSFFEHQFLMSYLFQT